LTLITETKNSASGELSTATAHITMKGMLIFPVCCMSDAPA
jgi:hypothetical protein